MPRSRARTDGPDNGFSLEPISDQPSFVPLRHAVLERLRSAILEGLLPPGLVLSESRLAAQLNVSRTPLREALRVLESEGLVAVGRGRKMIVTAPTPRDIDEIYSIRSLVEAEALRRITPSDAEIIEKLENCIARGADGLKSSGSRALTDPQNDFHLVLVSILDNRRLQDFLNSVYGLATSFRFLSMEEEGEARAAMRDHMEILAFLKLGRTEDAIARLKDHIRVSRENLKQRLYKT